MAMPVEQRSSDAEPPSPVSQAGTQVGIDIVRTRSIECRPRTNGSRRDAVPRVAHEGIPYLPTSLLLHIGKSRGRVVVAAVGFCLEYVTWLRSIYG